MTTGRRQQRLYRSARQIRLHRIHRSIVGYEKRIALPSVVKRGDETPRSRSSVALNEPAHCCHLTERAPGGPCRKRRTSSRRLREKRSISIRTPLRTRTSRASGHWRELFLSRLGFGLDHEELRAGSRSGSSEWLLMKAMRVPSGDHEGELSSHLLFVSRSSFFVATSKR
jgi:hypothetical protein